MEIQIVPFEAEYVTAVAAIEADSYQDPWSERSFHEIMILSDTSWVALSGGTVVGYLITQWVLDEIHILNIAVKGAFRRMHVASSLLVRLLDLGVRRGMRDIFLEVRVSNVSAQATYRKFGFTVLATRKAYYSNGEDAFVMYRQLESVPEQPEAALEQNMGDRHGH